MHLVVDGICGFVIFSSLYPLVSLDNAFVIFILYNFCAFVLQPLTGFLIDKFNYDKLLLICLTFVLALCLCVNLNPFLSCILLGISNSFFHTIGGKYVLKNKQNSMSLQGLFVSLGAIGLVLGSYFYGNILKVIFLFLIFVLLSLLIFLKDKNIDEKTEHNPKIKNLVSREAIIIVVLLLIVTFVRAFRNKGTVYSWNINKNTILLISTITALGKIIGGVLGDKFGIRNTILLSFIISFISIFLTGKNMYLDLLSILAINFSMPITLFLLNKSFPNHEGFNFGLLAAVLFPGYLVGMNEFVSSNITIFAPIAIIISTTSLIFVHYKENKYGIIH